MVATSIMSTDAEMNAMAGENVDTTGWVDANKTSWGLQAENFLVVLSRYDYSTNFGSLDAKSKLILSEYVARYTGMCGIMYNMKGDAASPFTSRIEAENMINVHIFRLRAIERLLKDQKYVDIVKAV